MLFFAHLLNFAFHKAEHFLTIQNASSVKRRSYIMEFWTSMYNMVSLQFQRDMKVGLPFTALSRDDSLECTVLHTTIRFSFERSSSTWRHTAQYAGATTLSLLRCTVPTRPALHPQHVNPIHGISTVNFLHPLALPPSYDGWPGTYPTSSHIITELSPRLWRNLIVKLKTHPVSAELKNSSTLTYE